MAGCVANVYLDPYFLHQTTQGNVIFFILSLVVFCFHYRGRGGVVCAIGDMDGFFYALLEGWVGMSSFATEDKGGCHIICYTRGGGMDIIVCAIGDRAGFLMLCYRRCRHLLQKIRVASIFFPTRGVVWCHHLLSRLGMSYFSIQGRRQSSLLGE